MGYPCCHVMLLFVVGATVVLRSSADVRTTALNGHNSYRRQEARDEKVANMNALVWSSTMESRARAWASKCRWGHEKYSDPQQGENLFAMWPYNRAEDYYINSALQDWMSEKEKYNRDRSFGCCSGNNIACCHYTQVVSAKSASVGCVVTRCRNLHNRAGTSVIATNAAYVACFYNPHGNFHYNGNYMPYRYGPPCSQCDAGDVCRNALCT